MILIWRSILAVVAGYLLAALGIGVLRETTAILLRHFAADGTASITFSYRLLKIIYTLVSGIAGGYVAAAAAVAGRKLRWHAVAVSALLAGAFLMSLGKYSAQPQWYFRTLLIVAGAGPILGGYLDQRVDRSPEVKATFYRLTKLLVGGFLIGAAIVEYHAPSSDLLLLINAPQRPTAMILACTIGSWMVYSGLRREGPSKPELKSSER
jgi:hypothetical protein